MCPHQARNTDINVGTTSTGMARHWNIAKPAFYLHYIIRVSYISKLTGDIGMAQPSKH